MTNGHNTIVVRQISLSDTVSAVPDKTKWIHCATTINNDSRKGNFGSIPERNGSRDLDRSQLRELLSKISGEVGDD